VVIVTGAGRGIGRAHALELARHGARVVVNDLGTGGDGAGASGEPADQVVAEIVAGGGEAYANRDDIADWAGAGRLIAGAVDRWGRLDAVVNNAGFVRDRMFVNTSEEEWDAVVRVHLKGHFAVARHAAAYWRDAKKRGDAVDARIINTTSGAGLQGSVGQASYSAAKAGIAALTLVQAAEQACADMMKKPDDGFDAMAPENIAPIVTWLASAESRAVTGRVFEVSGGSIAISDGWRPCPKVDVGRRWEAQELGAVVNELIGGAPAPMPVYGAG
jgi:NAD(P)-dependent dehydrogenase (short-subunit alcohol dehydrogenase family)